MITEKVMGSLQMECVHEVNAELTTWTIRVFKRTGMLMWKVLLSVC